MKHACFPFLTLAAILLASAGEGRAQVPANDLFAAGMVISGALPITLSGNLAGATLESGEPEHNYKDVTASVWWRWTATATATYRLDTIGSSFDTALAVYTGSSVGALTQIASDEDSAPDLTSFLQFNAVSGTTYHFVVAGSVPAGSIALRISQPAVPAHDTWASAEVLTGSGPFTSLSIGASLGTLEPGEPSPGDFMSYSRSFWWKWTAPAAGAKFICGTKAGFSSGKMQIFTGSSLAGLTPLAGAIAVGDPVIFQPTAGTTYYIRGAFYPWAGDLMTFYLRSWNPPINDNWASASILPSSLPSVTTGSMVDAISEISEPDSEAGGGSIWWKWTASFSGPVQVVADPYVIDSDDYLEASVAVFQGMSLDDLVALTPDFNNYPYGAFTAVSGQEYFIRLYKGSFSQSSPSVSLTVKAGPPPPANDHFASGVAMTGLPSQPINGTVSSASRETSEPDTDPSVWYRWIATTTGTVGLVLNQGNGTLAQAAVFTGNSLGGLTPVSEAGDTQFPVTAGTTYHLRVAGHATYEYGGDFLIRIVPVPSNDNFATPVVLTGLPVTGSGTTEGSSSEQNFSNFGDVWYSWTCPVSGPIVFTLAPSLDSSAYLYASISTGSSPTTLTHVTGTDTLVRFTGVAGTTYRIRVETAGNSGPFQLAFAQAPANDYFANPIPIPAGASATVTGDLLGSFYEDEEPGRNYQTLWWRWTAAQSGAVTITADTSNPDLFLGINVWVGTSLTNLTGFTGRNGRITFDATAGTTYRIQAGVSDPVVISSPTTLTLYTAPANDAFASASPLVGSGPVTATGWNFAAVRENDDPLRGTSFATHAFYPVWWKWTAPGPDLVVIDTAGSQFNTQLHVYQGSSLANLQLVRASDDASANRTSRVSFFPQTGTTYYIRVSGGATDRQGNISLNLRQYSAANTLASHLQRGRAALEGGTAGDIATADDHFAAAVILAPASTEAVVLRAITRLGRIQQQTPFTALLAQWGFSTKRANLVRPRYLAPRTAAGIANPPSGADTAQALAFANTTLLPELAIFEASLATVTSPTFSLPMTDSETQLRSLSIDAADLRILRAAAQLLKAFVHTANTFNSDLRVKTLLDLHDGKDLNAESLVQAASSFLERRAPDDRIAAKAAFKAANSLYQPAWNAMQNRPDGAGNSAFLFYIPEWEDTLYTERSEDANDAALSLDGPVTWDGATINLSALVTTSASLRSLLPVLKWNKAVASTAPDPSFAGALPGGTQAIANQFLRNNQLLHDVSSYLAWMGNYLHEYEPEDQAPGADADGDGFDNFTEYVFNLNPEAFSNAADFQASGLSPNPANANQPHFTYTFIRLKSPAVVSYQILVSDNLTSWDATGAQLEPVGFPILQPDSVSEQVTFRLRQPASLTLKKYLKIKASVP